MTNCAAVLHLHLFPLGMASIEMPIFYQRPEAVWRAPPCHAPLLAAAGRATVPASPAFRNNYTSRLAAPARCDTAKGAEQKSAVHRRRGVMHAFLRGPALHNYTVRAAWQGPWPFAGGRRVEAGPLSTPPSST